MLLEAAAVEEPIAVVERAGRPLVRRERSPGRTHQHRVAVLVEERLARVGVCSLLRPLSRFLEDAGALLGRVPAGRPAEVALGAIVVDEPGAVFVHRPEVPLEEWKATGKVAHACRRPHGIPNIPIGHLTAPAGRDRDHAVTRARAVQRGRGRALDDLDLIDVESIDVDHARAEDHAIHDIERLLVPAAGTDARGTAQQDRRGGARPAATLNDGRARDLALDGTTRVHRRHRQILGRELRDFERNLCALRRARHARDDDLLEGDGPALQGEVYGRHLIGLDRHLSGDGLVPDQLDLDDVGSHGNPANEELAVAPAQGTESGAGDAHLGARDGLTLRLCANGARDAAGLRG